VLGRKVELETRWQPYLNALPEAGRL